jgi:hypothetical protein
LIFVAVQPCHRTSLPSEVTKKSYTSCTHQLQNEIIQTLKTLTMLTSIATNVWTTHHPFVFNGVPTTSRMTIVRLNDGSLWVHSPVPISPQIKAQLDSLGDVRHVVAPSLAHHLFMLDFASHYPRAKLHGTPGLAAKRQDIDGLQTLPLHPGPWAPELEGVLFGGMPKVNETVWFHPASRTLIMTDICQNWTGPLGWKVRWWAKLSGVRERFDVPLIVRLLTRDRLAARASAQEVLRWPIERVVVGHNAVIEKDAKAQLTWAFRHFQ